MMSMGRDLGDFGHEPEPALRDLLLVLTGGASPTAAAVALVAAAARDQADRGVVKLLPLLKDNSAMPSLPAYVQQVVVQHYLRTRARFVLLESAVRPLVASFTARDIPVMFLKGFALACRAYPSPGHRPMGDVDIAVPHGLHAEAAVQLIAAGFREIELVAGRRRPKPGLGIHALTFRSEAAGLNLDLHYNILNASLWEGADDGFWAAAEPLGYPGLEPALTLAPEHHVFHACVHGYSRSVLQLSIRWMLDAHFVLLRTGAGFRWALVEEEAGRHRCGPLLAATLGYLARYLESPVPDEVLERLAGQPMPTYDRAYFRDFAELNETTGLGRRIRILWNACQRQLDQRFTTPVPFAIQLARRWGVASARQLLSESLQHIREPRYMRAKRSAVRGSGTVPERK
jgi:hypothetical protein